MMAEIKPKPFDEYKLGYTDDEGDEHLSFDKKSEGSKYDAATLLNEMTEQQKEEMDAAELLRIEMEAEKDNKQNLIDDATNISSWQMKGDSSQGTLNDVYIKPILGLDEI